MLLFVGLLCLAISGINSQGNATSSAQTSTNTNTSPTQPTITTTTPAPTITTPAPTITTPAPTITTPTPTTTPPTSTTTSPAPTITTPAPTFTNPAPTTTPPTSTTTTPAPTITTPAPSITTPAPTTTPPTSTTTSPAPTINTPATTTTPPTSTTTTPAPTITTPAPTTTSPTSTTTTPSPTTTTPAPTTTPPTFTTTTPAPTTTTPAPTTTTPAPTTTSPTSTTTTAVPTTTPSTPTPTTTIPALTTTTSAPTIISPISRETEVADLLAAINYKWTDVTMILNSGTIVIQNTKISAANLQTTLPFAIVNKNLASAFSFVQSGWVRSIGTGYGRCFLGIVTTKANIIQRSRESFSSCTLPLTTSTNQQLISVAQNIRALNEATIKARVKVNSCSFVQDSALFQACIAEAQTLYASMGKIESDVNLLRQRWRNNSLSLSTCVGRAVNTGDTLMEAYNTQIRACNSFSPLAAVINIPVIVPTNESFYTTQIQNNLGTGLEEADSSTVAAIQNATYYVDLVKSSRGHSLAALKDSLLANYSSVRSAFAVAESDFTGVPAATGCVNIMRAALTINFNTKSAQIFACLQRINSFLLSNQLTVVLNKYNLIRGDTDKLDTQCLNENTFFTTQGVRTCVLDARSNLVTELQILEISAKKIVTDAQLAAASVDTCYSQGSKNVDSQIGQIKTNFENCIYTVLQLSYTIVL